MYSPVPQSDDLQVMATLPLTPYLVTLRHVRPCGPILQSSVTRHDPPLTAEDDDDDDDEWEEGS